jgi:tRNA threonylcarbamoyl adenosine modification protein YeaZ
MILVYDCSISGFSVGLFDAKENLLFEENFDIPFSYTEHLILTIQKGIKSIDGEWKSLTRIITTRGPGSFTGIRAGIACGIGLKTALKIPIQSVTTLEALAYSFLCKTGLHKNKRDIQCILDNKCGKYYHQSFEIKDELITALSTVKLIDPSDLPLDTVTVAHSSDLKFDSNVNKIDLNLKALLIAPNNFSPLIPEYIQTQVFKEIK